MSKDHNKKGGALPILEFALSAAVAAAAGFVYMSHKEDIDKEAKKRIDQITKFYKQSKPEIEKRVKKIWGEVSKSTVGMYLDLRSSILHEIDERDLVHKGKILKKHYDEIVEDVVEMARKKGWLNPEMETQLAEMFRMDWDKVQKTVEHAMMVGAHKTAMALRKIKVERAVKKVNKHIKKSVAKKPSSKKKSAPKKKAAPKKNAKKRK